MEIKASAKYIRMSPTKVRLAVDLVRGMEVNKAIAQLVFSKKWSAEPVIKLIKSAIANAENNFDLDKDNLLVKEIKVDGGPSLKRWMPKAHGRATQILKRTSHISVTLSEIKESGKTGPKKVKIEEPVKLNANIKGEASVKVKGDKKGEEKTSEETAEEKKAVAAHGAEGRHGHAKLEGGHKKGFVGKMFQRKSG